MLLRLSRDKGLFQHSLDCIFLQTNGVVYDHLRLDDIHRIDSVLIIEYIALTKVFLFLEIIEMQKFAQKTLYLDGQRQKGL